MINGITFMLSEKLKKKLDKKKKKTKKEEEEEEEFIFSDDDSDIDLQQFLPTNLKTNVFPMYNNNEDDDDDAREYLPHLEMVSDDGDTDEGGYFFCSKFFMWFVDKLFICVFKA